MQACPHASPALSHWARPGWKLPFHGLGRPQSREALVLALFLDIQGSPSPPRHHTEPAPYSSALSPGTCSLWPPARLLTLPPLGLLLQGKVQVCRGAARPSCTPADMWGHQDSGDVFSPKLGQSWVCIPRTSPALRVCRVSGTLL